MKTTLLMLVLLAGVAQADPVEILLPALHGDYDAGAVLPNDAPNSRTTTFTVPPEVTTITSMRMVISGSGSDEWAIRIRHEPPVTTIDTLSIPASIRLILTAPTLGERLFWGGVGFGTSPLTDATANLSEDGPWLDRNLLIGTTVTAEMYCPNAYVDPWIDPLVTLTDASLVLEAEIVPAASRSWGEIKALYR